MLLARCVISMESDNPLLSVLFAALLQYLCSYCTSSWPVLLPLPLTCLLITFFIRPVCWYNQGPCTCLLLPCLPAPEGSAAETQIAISSSSLLSAEPMSTTSMTSFLTLTATSSVKSTTPPLPLFSTLMLVLPG